MQVSFSVLKNCKIGMMAFFFILSSMPNWFPHGEELGIWE